MNVFLKSALYKYVFRKPSWLAGPSVLQLELHNYCNLCCIYCNVEGFHCGRHGVLSLNQVEKVMCDVAKADTVKEVRLFLNNEPTLQVKGAPCLCEATKLAKKLLNCKTIIYSNGSTSDREAFLDKNLDEIHLTISAASRNTYFKVHSRDFFNSVLSNYQFILRNKRVDQGLFVHFVAVKENFEELSKWKELFGDAKQVISPLHSGYAQDASKKCLEGLDYQATLEESTLKGKMASDLPCTLWNNLSMSCFGDLLQCCDAPYRFNYGCVGEVNALDAWKQRLANKMNNPACQACILKNRYYKPILKRYIG